MWLRSRTHTSKRQEFTKQPLPKETEEKRQKPVDVSTTLGDLNSVGARDNLTTDWANALTMPETERVGVRVALQMVQPPLTAPNRAYERLRFQTETFRGGAELWFATQNLAPRVRWLESAPVLEESSPREWQVQNCCFKKARSKMC